MNGVRDYVLVVDNDMLADSQATTLLAFHVLISMMNERGVMLAVDDTGLEFVGPGLPAWCEPIVCAWWDLLLAAHVSKNTHRLYSCDECGEIMLLSRARAGRRCHAARCKGEFAAPMPLHFIDSPKRKEIK